MRFAAIDIGTVTCRLLVADVQNGSLVELERQCAITNLGIGVDKTGVLMPDAIERVTAKIAEYVACIESYKTPEQSSIPVVAMATSASRDAKNAHELVEGLKRLGVTLSVIPGQKEAALSFAGASRAFSRESLMVVDIGGGSTEIIVGSGGETPEVSYSFDIGCRRVTERFIASNPPTEKELAEAHAWVKEVMVPFFANEIAPRNVERVVAVAGTATSVVSIDKAMVVYNSQEVDGTEVPKETLMRIYSHLASLTLDERKQVVGLEPDRASVIVAGMLILSVVLDLAKRDSFTVSESDILHGIIMDAARNKSA